MNEEHQRRESPIKEKTESLRAKVSEVEEALRQKKETAEEQKRALIKETVDMVEGNEALSFKVEQSPEYNKAFDELKDDLRRAEEIIIQSEKNEEPDADLRNKIESLKEAIEHGKQSFEKMEEFNNKQEVAAKNSIGFAVDTFIDNKFAGTEGIEKEALKKEVKKEIENRQQESAREGEKERIKEQIKEYGAIVEEVKKEFETLREKIQKELEGFEEHIKKPELLRDIAGKIQEIEKKYKKIGSFFSYESKRWRLKDKINDTKGELKKVHENLWRELNDITSQAEYFLRRQKKEYGHGKGEKRLGILDEPYHPSHTTRGDVDPELKTMSDEKVEGKNKLLQDIEEYVYEIKQKLNQYVKGLDKIIPPNHRQK